MGASSINAKRLKEARLFRRFTMEELANMVDIQKQAISQFENGKANPEPFKLKRIADVLGFPPSYFGQNDISVCSGNTYFRALYSSSKKDLASQQIKARYLAQVYMALRELISFPSLVLPELPEECTIEELASFTRKAWELGEDPIHNMVSLLERHGILVGEFATESQEIDAFYQYNEINGMPVFCVVLGTDKKSFFRRQYSCAHELGHILMHERYEDLSEISRDDYRLREHQANAFAAAFLLPSNSFCRDVALYPNKLDYYFELKKKWGVSAAAMILRAKNLKMISDNQYVYLMRQLSSKGYKTCEPLDGEIPYHHPKALRQAIELLLNEGGMTGYQVLQAVEKYGLALSSEVFAELLNLNAEMFAQPKENNNIVMMPTRE